MLSPTTRIAVLGIALALAIVSGVRLVRRLRSNSLPSPSLAGVEPSALGQTRAIDAPEPERRSYRAPLGWDPDGSAWRRANSEVYVHAWDVARGVPVATPSERRRAAELAARLNHDSVQTPREYTVAGQPAFEFGITMGGGFWKLITYVFFDRTVMTVDCIGRDEERLRAFSACAAVVSSVAVSR